MEWRRLSEREGGRAPDGPYDGVPPHLESPLIDWLRAQFGIREALRSPKAITLVMSVANAARVVVRDSEWSEQVMDSLAAACRADAETFLDVIDATLATTRGGDERLRALLEAGGSVWTVAADGKSLRRRVDVAVQQAADRAMSPRDPASDELAQAWAAAYGRNPDASDAWDHAIKATEAVLIPVIVPAQAKATMGHVLGQLRRPENRWELTLPGAGGVAPLVGMLSLLWPNPDRHASGERRAPTLEEAQAVVQLAVTIVQWTRDGVLRRA
jgi:hypothetical protein